MRHALWKTIAVLLAGIALYSLAGFLLAPHFVKRWIEATVATDDGRRLEIESVAINPYTLTLSLTDVTLYGPQNPAMVSIKQIDAHVDITSVIERKWLFRETVELIDIVIAGPSSDTPVLIARTISGTGVVIDAAQRSVSIERARLESSEFRLQRDRAGNFELPLWLRRLLFDRASAAAVSELIELSDGRVTYIDLGVAPPVRIDADNIDGSLAQSRNNGDMVTALSFHGQLAKSGVAEIAAEWHPSAPDDFTNLDLAVRDFDLSIISPYFDEITGRAIDSGILNLSVNTSDAGGRLSIDIRLVTENLRLGEHITAATAEELPLDMAVALLEDENGRIDIAIPVQKNSIHADFDPATEFSLALQERILQITTRPFGALANLVGHRGEDLETLGFVPGSAEVTARTAERLTLLVTALERRPRLGLAVYPRYDPVADRQALAQQQIRLHIMLATSAGPPGQVVRKPIDFDDAKVRVILDEFSATRLPPKERATIADHFADKQWPYYRAIFEALVANENVSDSALSRLARFRARSVLNSLVDNGVDARRLIQADDIEAISSEYDQVNVRLALQLDPT